MQMIYRSGTVFSASEKENYMIVDDSKAKEMISSGDWSGKVNFGGAIVPVKKKRVRRTQAQIKADKEAENADS